MSNVYVLRRFTSHRSYASSRRGLDNPTVHLYPRTKEQASAYSGNPIPEPLPVHIPLSSAAPSDSQSPVQVAVSPSAFPPAHLSSSTGTRAGPGVVVPPRRGTSVGLAYTGGSSSSPSARSGRHGSYDSAVSGAARADSSGVSMPLNQGNAGLASTSSNPSLARGGRSPDSAVAHAVPSGDSMSPIQGTAGIASTGTTQHLQVGLPPPSKAVTNPGYNTGGRHINVGRGSRSSKG